MDTATISYRVADFLKKYPPFQAMEDADLLALAGHGRVRFHERNEHILSQGQAHTHLVFVIQQGVVSLWGEANGQFELRDVRGPGDLLGVERFNGAPACLHSARSATDVVLYALPADELETLLDKYPGARQFVASYSTVTLDYQVADGRRRPEDVFLHDVVKARRVVTCTEHHSIRDAARSMRAAGVDAIAVLGADGNARGAIASSDLLAWVADGSGNPDLPVAQLLQQSDGTAVLAITADGTPAGELHAIVTAADLASAFGDQPVSILRDVRHASSTSELRALNHRARAFALQHLVSPRSVDWLARFTTLIDTSIVTRVIALAGVQESDASCWAVAGSSGRSESITRVMPELVLIADSRQAGSAAACQRVMDLLADCDYFPRTDLPFEAAFYAATIDEWKRRFDAWVRNPILEQMYLARALFDMQPIHGARSLYRDIEATIAGAVDRDFLRIIANDCVARLPPLTFFQDAVVDDLGERSSVFQLDRNALTPLVDVARVYGIAAGRVLGGSTHERLAMARRLLPRHEAIFREAADTLSIVLWQQGRIGIRQGTGGAELPPNLLGRHDRQVLKSGFRVIHRLIELTANYEWIEAVT